ncbi:putative peptidoglycan binding domain-containing protein [Goodfellowiella coeruleoviolacea]|uniref:Peptidoglycan binding domain-containing protein n=1 Tax=Goodfellowiella coeruleoviolacea TaxID=334858 RepID=A0AAE3GFU6_9PSEU|nr:putative peptidoglycan binding domain-containing protein [Goodfellowiella coeruleoviolacea]
MDPQVQAAQHWLNQTYGGVNGWVPLEENGQTGWPVMYGLRRGLQHELGISPVTSGFGPATTAAFKAQIGRIDGGTTKENLLRLLSAALWCKGYPGFYDGAAISWTSLSTSVGWVRDDLGLGSANPYVDVKLMASLLTMDAYVLVGSGTSAVRDVQRWLNATYLNRADFAIVPCDGIYGRPVQTAMLYGLQYEIGMADGVANGNFGPGTRDGIRNQATVSPGSVDGAKRFVRLYQAVLRFNRYDAPFNGTFDSATADHTRSFQSFMELPVTGRGDYSTWCALLVSSGDTSISTKGFDTNKQLSATEAQGARQAGYTTVGRYTVGANKFITADELDGLRAAGLKLVPIHQRFNNAPEVMTRANGRTHGIEAIERCLTLGLPTDSLVFFSVDFDALGETIHGPVADYFQGVADAFETSLTAHLKVGVYGTRNVCSIIIDEKELAEAAFVAVMSTGFSGNMGFPMPAQWHYNQIIEIQTQLPGSDRTIPIDKDVVSVKARPVDLSSVVSPPIERDNSPSATGFDAFFEWLVRAEVACERGLVQSSTLLTNLKPYAAFVPDYVAHWLQRPKYWSDGYTDLWPNYTPTADQGSTAVLARLAAEEELGRLSPNKPVSNRDIAHYAATLRGYTVWGIPSAANDYGFGDLGGWPLDLLQAWGVYEKARQASPGLDQRQFLTERIGVAGADGGFDWSDVVADCDAYLVARSLQDNHSMSGALRGLLKLTDKQRVAKFYNDRFGRSEDNVVAAFGRLADGIDVGGVNFPITTNRLRDAAGADAMPTAAEARICGEVFARLLTAQG